MIIKAKEESTPSFIVITRMNKVLPKQIVNNSIISSVPIFQTQDHNYGKQKIVFFLSQHYFFICQNNNSIAILKQYWIVKSWHWILHIVYQWQCHRKEIIEFVLRTLVLRQWVRVSRTLCRTGYGILVGYLWPYLG
jgi:hypothetical protein